MTLPLPIRLGVAGVSLRSLNLASALVVIRRAGLDSISVHPSHVPWENPPAGWEQSLPDFKAEGVTPLCCGVLRLPDDEIAVRQACAYARALNVSVLACSPAPAALPLLTRCLREFDLCGAIHNHGPEDDLWPTPHEIWQAIRPLDARLGLCVDVGHTYRAGADPAESIRSYRSRVYDVHLNDTAAGIGEADIPVEIGRGCIDHRSVIRALVDIRYRHVAWIEYENHPSDPLPGLAESVGYVRGMLRA